MYNICMEELLQLNELYLTEDAFYDALDIYFTKNFKNAYERVLYGSGSETDYDTFYTALLTSIAFAVYNYYKRDKVLYKEQSIFEERMFFDILVRVPNYVVKYNIMKLFEDYKTQTRYDDTSKMATTSKEKGYSASGVVQSSASTPTGVDNTEVGSEIIISKEVDATGTTTSTNISDDEYVAKYTNYQTKTNGAHNNDVSRDSEHSRKGGLLDILTFSNNLPKAFLDEVLKDMSVHFVYLY